MNEAHRLLQLKRIRDAIAHDERSHSPEEVAAAAAALERPLIETQPELQLEPRRNA